MATREITWTTSKGTAVRLSLADTKTVWADGDSVEVPAWDLTCSLPTTTLPAPRLETHPTAGYCLHAVVGRTVYVPIPAEVRDAVTALVNEYWTVRDRRAAANLEAGR